MPARSVCGVILVSDDPERLATFYADVLDVAFEREDHGGLDVHFGVDLRECHLGIHPPSNFAGHRGGGAVTAFQVDDVDAHAARLAARGAALVLAPHDEGFGRTATWRDPDGNLVELVELTHVFGGDGS